MNERYVLVTGGAGYIGSHTCKALSKAGYTPVTFDNLSTGNIAAIKWGPFIQGDLLNESDLIKTFSSYKFLGVIHFAAKAYVGESVKNPLKYFEGNISTTVNLLKAMEEADLNNIVFSSSCATYGEPKTDTISESLEQHPVNPYGYSKLVCEQIIKYYSQAHPLKYGILRYFNAAGADPDNEIGEYHTPETHLIPLAINAALNEEIFHVFGSDYATKDGTAIRDYIHVSDLAAAHVGAFNKLFEGGESFICNLGTGTGYSVLDVINSMKKLFPNFKYSLESKRPGDPAKLVSNTSLSSKILGLKPVNSDLDTILSTALNWEKAKNSRL